MNIIALSGILGTFFSIATFFIPDAWKSKKVTLALFVFVLTVLCSIVTNLNSKLSRISKVSRAANELASKRTTDFGDDGYIQAALAFLEQNKDLYPDAYNRAKISYEKLKNNTDKYSGPSIYLASEVDGLIRGIAILNSEK